MAAVGMPLIGGQSRTEANHSIGAGQGDLWTFEEDKAFEMALVANWMQPDRVAKCQAAVPAKSKEALQHRYLLLEADVANIARGAMRLPTYGASVMPSPLPVPKGKKAAGEERRKGVPWTEEEHRLFVAGLAEFGKGDWRSISRNYVLTRTPTQVASHAQKYFIRMNSGKKNDKRRSSIHDITSSSGNGGYHSKAAGSLPRAAQGARAPLQGAGNSPRPPMPKPVAPTGQIPRPRPAALPARSQQQQPMLQGGRPLLQGGQQRPYGASRAPGVPPTPRSQTSAQSIVKSAPLEHLSQPGASVPAGVALPTSAGSLPDRASQPVSSSAVTTG